MTEKEPEKSPALKVTIRNESQKLKATFFNTLGANMVAIGSIAPTIQALSHPSEPSDFNTLAIVGFIVAGFALHLYGQSYIQDLEEA